MLVILAIAAGLATLAFDGDGNRSAERDARRFAAAIEHAAARAALGAETLGVSADGNGWRFWRRERSGRRWLPITDDEVLQPRVLLPPATLAALTYAGAPLAADAIVPLRATGRNDPFAFALTGERSRIVLAMDPLNRVVMTVTATP